jgi:ATP-dependent DNA helicase RecQ
MNEVSAPLCPACGGAMKHRVARQGSRAGSAFWGCASYPKCRGTLNIEGADVPRSSGSHRRLVNVRMRSLHRDQSGSPSQTSMLQTVALPFTYLRALTSNGSIDDSVRSATSWRLDYPLPRTLVNERQRTIAAIAESILTRGTATVTFPDLEHFFDGGNAEPETVASAIIATSLDPTCPAPAPRHLFDSDEERLLAQALSSSASIRGRGWHVIPQVNLSSISSSFDERSEARCDLLLVNALSAAAFVVEVDGLQHQPDGDAQRDAALRKSGVETIRVSADRLRKDLAGFVDQVSRALSEIPQFTPVSPEAVRVVRWTRFSHQIALACVAALKTGWLSFSEPWQVGVSVPEHLASEDAADLAQLAVEQARELIHRLLRLYGESGLPEATVVSGEPDAPGAVHIGAGADVADSAAIRLAITDIAFPLSPRLPITASLPLRPQDPDENDVHWFLNYLFRKERFLEGQWTAIRRTLIGEDTLVLLPTGGGKSMVFQLSAFLLPGRCLIVEPIISLSEDQCDNLIRIGIDRCVPISSAVATHDKRAFIEEFEQGQYLFSYVTPQRFQIPAFREALQALTTSTPVSMIAVDEAHCVSEWGHGFMPAYLNLGRATRQFCSSNGLIPPVVGLTGTASRVVLKDVQRELGITSFDAIVTPKSFDREELRFQVIRCRSDEKRQRLRAALRSLPSEFGTTESTFFGKLGDRTHSGIVFCPHVRGEYGVQQISSFLSDELRIDALQYSGKSGDKVNQAEWSVHKRRVALQFKSNDTPLIVATKAFGMGIDKPNIRYTVHISLPESIEAFYQEAGRAGRDHVAARCTLIVSDDHHRRNERLLGPDTSLEEIREAVKERNPSPDDIDRALYFHANSFKGSDAEIRDVRRMIKALDGAATRTRRTVSWRPWLEDDEEGQSRSEKAIHRLLIIGFVSDYTLDHARGEYGVELSGASRSEMVEALARYVGTYQSRLGETYRQKAARQAESIEGDSEFVLSLARLLIAFVYERLELARRRSLLEMFNAATQAGDGEKLRGRILQYLQATEWDEKLEELREMPDGGTGSIASILDEVASPQDALALRGATARLLTSYPDVPGLLLVRAAAEILAPDQSYPVAEENLFAALRYATTTFELDPRTVAEGIAALVRHAAAKKPFDERVLSGALGSTFMNRNIARELTRALPLPLAALPAAWLRDDLLRRTVELNDLPNHRSQNGIDGP